MKTFFYAENAFNVSSDFIENIDDEDLCLEKNLFWLEKYKNVHKDSTINSEKSALKVSNKFIKK